MVDPYRLTSNALGEPTAVKQGALRLEAGVVKFDGVDPDDIRFLRYYACVAHTGEHRGQPVTIDEDPEAWLTALRGNLRGTYFWAAERRDLAQTTRRW